MRVPNWLTRIQGQSVNGIGAMVVAMFMAMPAVAGPPQMSHVEEATGFPVLELGGARAVRSSMIFWGEAWRWVGWASRTEVAAPFSYTTSAQSDALGLTMKGVTQRLDATTWQTDLVFQAKAERIGVTGGGVIFGLDVANGSDVMGEPSLLAGQQGWRWGKPGGPAVEVRFDPPLPSVYFEQQNKSEVRAFFFKGVIPAGETRYRMTWKQSSGVALLPTLSERLGGPPRSEWPLDPLRADRLPIDMGFLNAPDRPAGSRGRVLRKGSDLAFSDGSPARFWGTNVNAYALFSTPKEAVREQARRLAALGYNLVRVHHHDSPWVSPNIFGVAKPGKGTLTLDEGSLDRLDWWIKCLKDEGIYVWLDLQVQRAFKTEDGIWAFDEVRKGKDAAEMKGYMYVNGSAQNAMKQFNEAYLLRKNNYTGVSYRDEPAVMGLMLTNENDLTAHFGNALLPDKNVPQHNRIYMAAAEAFSDRHGLPRDKVWRSWEHGVSRVFLNDLERAFSMNLMDSLKSAGVQALISTTSSWGESPISSLPALTAGDMVDVHSYGSTGALERNPLRSANLLHWIGAAQVQGFPLTVSEWNAEPFPLHDRHVLPLYLAATASHQGWDALMHFAYTQQPVAANSASNWNAYNDPSVLAMMPAAALLYRERHVAEASSTYVFSASAEDFFGKGISAGNAAALRTAMERGRLLIAMPKVPALPWLNALPAPAGATVLRDPRTPLIPPDATETQSDTGEIIRNWNDGVLTISTARTRAAMGWLGGKTVTLPGVELKLNTRHASIAVQSLDGKPVGESSSLLLSIGTRSQPQAGDKTPFIVEGIDGTISVKAPAGLRVLVKDGLSRSPQIPTAYADGRYALRFDGRQAVYWVTLQKP